MLVRIERYILHRRYLRSLRFLFWTQDTRRHGRHALSFHQYGPWLASPFCGVDRGVLLWGSVCHHVKRGGQPASSHLRSEEVQLRGRIVERPPDPDLQIMDPISHKYTGQPFPMRNPAGRGALVIGVEKVRYTKLPFAHTPPTQ